MSGQAGGHGHVRLAILLSAALALAAGCAQPGEPQAFAQRQALAGRSATLSIDSYPPLTMRGTSLRLALEDAAGRPVPGASVVFDLGMPACQEMPANRRQAVEVEPGLYQAPALFTMAGYWQVRAEVSGVGEDQVFTFYLSAK